MSSSAPSPSPVRPTARLPKYCRQRSKGRGDRAFVTVDGKRIMLGAYGSEESRQRYRDVLRAHFADLPQPTPQRSPRPTLAVLMAEYLEHAIRLYGGPKSTEVVHFVGVFRILRREFGDLAAEKFGPKAFKQVREAMIAKGWSRRYVNDQSYRLKRFVAWCVEEERIPSSVYHGLQAVRGLQRGRTAARETPPVEAVPDGIVEATIPYLGDEVADMVRILRLIAARPGELCQMRAVEIDTSGDVWLYRPRRHKTERFGKQRQIAIGPRAQRILNKYLERDKCFGYTTASFRRAIHRACDRAFPHPTLAAKESLTSREESQLREWQSQHRWSPNQLRHTAATEVRRKFGLEAAQVALGHSSADVTQIYAERDLKKAIEIAANIG